MGFKVVGFRILGFRVLGLRVVEFRVVGFRVLGVRVVGFRIQLLGLRAWAPGLRVLEFRWPMSWNRIFGCALYVIIPARTYCVRLLHELGSSRF